MPMDPISLEVLRHALVAVAEEMNANLVRSAFSPNIKERRDCSCAVFQRDGQMVAQAATIPVHLGAMPAAVRGAISIAATCAPGDVIALNDPYLGGAHLPDVTFVLPVFYEDEIEGYVASRAHHADIGGKEPGSLAGDATEIYQEGLRIPPVRLWREWQVDSDLKDLILLNVRTPRERWGDLRAQFAACRAGHDRFHDLVARDGLSRLREGMAAILDYSERRMRAEIRRLPDGVYRFEDALEDDGLGSGTIPIRARLEIADDTLRVDFSGTSNQVRGPINAVLAVTESCVYYAIRAMTDPEIPPNAGCYRPITIDVPEGSVLAARPPSPVVGGNLETAQRVVDVLLGCLGQALPDREVAASQGTMNNVAIGGVDPRNGEPYTVYETIGGGWGGRYGADGVDGMHSHMTNTLNTPVEALETSYPLRVTRYELIPDSGGEGAYRGGLGIRRDIQILGHSARVSLLTERRVRGAYGVRGGRPGCPGSDFLLPASGDQERLPAKGSCILAPNDTVSLRTPGGGGWGTPSTRSAADIERDARDGRTRRIGRAANVSEDSKSSDLLY